jgi:hypothetical protein
MMQVMPRRIPWREIAVVLALGVVSARAQEPRTVSQDEILAAMRQCRGYVLTATANAPRLQVEVLRQLIREGEANDPARRPLHLGHREWFGAFLERTGLTPEEAPLYARMPYQVGQHLLVDYRRERVIEEVVKGPRPRTVANVTLSWPKVPGAPKKFSYDDLLSDPTLRVTQKRVIRYRLVDYGDRLWYAEVEGLHGRPTSGALGVLFKILGEARVVETRSTLSPDGLQIVRGHGKKLLINRVGTVTVWPDGHARMGVPKGRPDLVALAQRLKEPLEIRFRPFEDDDEAGS